MKNNIVIIVVIVILVGAGAFFGGMKYQESKATGLHTARQFQGGMGGGQNGQNGQGRFTGNGRPVAGEILSVDDKSITVKLQDGSSKIVLLSDKTSINKASEGTKDDLKTGQRVAVFGSENSDGSVTASNIQLNPVFGVSSRSANQVQK